MDWSYKPIEMDWTIKNPENIKELEPFGLMVKEKSIVDKYINTLNNMMYELSTLSIDPQEFEISLNTGKLKFEVH